MPISGLLLTLNASPDQQARAVSALQSRPDVLVGTASGRWLPVAIEAEDDTASRTTHDWLATLPGVEFVDVVHVSFETDVPASAAEAQPLSIV